MSRGIELAAAIAIAAGSAFYIPAYAQGPSVFSETFVANVGPNVDFLRRSSRLALSRSASGPIRSFARREAREQAADAETLAVHLPIDRRPAVDIAVVIGADQESLRANPSAGPTDLARLANSEGPPFDALYRAAQADALRQLHDLYVSYILNGDDPALRRLAVLALPKINRTLAELRRL